MIGQLDDMELNKQDLNTHRQITQQVTGVNYNDYRQETDQI